MKFVDSCTVDIVAGNGGNGVVAFRREKFVPFGGPSGGDGGKGGNIVFATDEGMSTLLDLTYSRIVRAPHGEHGQGKDCYGRAGKDLVVRVPVGTQVFDRETNTLLFDLDQPNTQVVVAHGGRGGRGNIHFATPYDRAPRRSEPGEAGEEKKIRLELKVMADVGLLGFPNVGKSTFIRACSRAQPKVADYPFTTLTPHLGVVRVGDEASFVIADIPGLIPGAAEGAGLGHRFLKHVERCRALLHLVTLDPGEGRDPIADYDALRHELEAFDPELAKRPQVVAMTKSDLPDVREAYEDLKKKFAKKKVKLHLVSAATQENVRDLCIELYKVVTGKSQVEDWDTPVAAEEEKAPVEATETAEEPKGKETAVTKKKTAARPKKKTAAKAKPTKKPAKKAAAPKKAVKKAATKKAAPKKAATKKAAPKKAVKKAATKKAATKKPVKKTVAKKKATAKKAVTPKKKVVAKKPVRKATAKKTTKKPASTKAKKKSRR
ncbi:GTPase ObgE [Labilithrix luteola]|uniref:GTPase ObgE n=1 Tax=Labilithrix luteola TaxID=1391654 RepID=UPI0011BAA8C5|nr:GTPase ObgE [Labilithrix luteola]